MKRTKLFRKLIYIILAIVGILFIFNNYIEATISIPGELDSVYNSNDSIISNIGGKIIWIAQFLMNTAAVIILMFAGIKYMTVAPEGKAEMKKKAIYLVTGAIMLFAASGIVKIISNIASQNI